jgi:hypothetical protein
MYEFSDTTAEHDLGAAAGRGVRVRVILDRKEKSVNSGAYAYFRDHHDRQPDQQVLRDLRDFLVADTNRSDVAAITTVFGADFAGHSVQPGHGADLVCRPHHLQPRRDGRDREHVRR